MPPPAIVPDRPRSERKRLASLIRDLSTVAGGGLAGPFYPGHDEDRDMIDGDYEAAELTDGNARRAVAVAVAAFQRKEDNHLPQYVWCPPLQMPDAETVLSWAVRGVTVSESPFAFKCVRAGPRTGGLAVRLARPKDLGIFEAPARDGVRR